MAMPFDYCKSETQNHHQTNQGYTLIQQPQQQMTTISPIINHHPQYTSIASSGKYYYFYLPTASLAVKSFVIILYRFVLDSTSQFFHSSSPHKHSSSTNRQQCTPTTVNPVDIA